MNVPSVIEPHTKPRREIASRMLCAFVTVLVLLTSILAYLTGFLFNFLFVLMLLAVPVTFGARLAGLIRRRLELRFVRNPFAPEMRWQLLQCLNRWCFWGLVAVTVTMAIPDIAFLPDEYRVLLYGFVWLPAGLLVLMQLFPRQRVSRAVNGAFAIGWLFLAQQLLQILADPPLSNAVVVAAPFRGEWVVFQGGRSTLLNHHYAIAGQRHALDFCKVIEGSTFMGDPKKLESYAAFGQDLLAPADGKVVNVVHDRPDEPIGGSDTQVLVGNHIVLEIGPEKFILLAHLMQGSIIVAEGEQVRSGQKIGRCGNSGNTSEPHLHLQAQTRADWSHPDLRTHPMLFSNVRRTRGGGIEQLARSDLRRNDRIVTAEESK